MVEEDRTDLLELRFEGRLADQGQVPASVLTLVLQGLQRTIYLLALEEERVEVRQRERISGEIEQRYVVMCAPPKAGSLTIEASLGDPASAFFGRDEIQSVSTRFAGVCGALATKDRQALSTLLPDRTRRQRILEAMRKMVPKKGTGIRFSISNGKTIFQSTQVERGIKSLSISGQDEESVRIVTGSLSKIDFDGRELTLVYPPTNRELRCHYTESIEELLLENPRELIQVSGKVILDEEDHPKEIRDVDDIRELDLSPFFLSEIVLRDRVVRFRKTAVLEPSLDESKQILCLEDQTIGIDVCGFSRDELDEALTEEIDVLWHEYALASDESLSPKALELKRNLRDRIEEVVNAEV